MLGFLHRNVNQSGFTRFEAINKANDRTVLQRTLTNVSHCSLSLQLIAKQLFSTMYATEQSLTAQHVFIQSSIVLTTPLSVKLPAPNPPTRSLFRYTSPNLHVESEFAYFVVGKVGVTVVGLVVVMVVGFSVD